MQREELIESLPSIPYWNFWNPYRKPCLCGGTMVAYRVADDSDEIRVFCTDCDLDITVSKPYIKPSKEEIMKSYNQHR